MEISSSSWHYRLLDVYYDWHIPRSLCQYFWSVVLGVLVFPITFPFFLLALGVEWNTRRLDKKYGYKRYYHEVWSQPFGTYCRPNKAEKYKKKYYDRLEREAKRKKPRRPRQKGKYPGLLKSWLQAKKQKVCPIITIVD